MVSAVLHRETDVQDVKVGISWLLLALTICASTPTLPCAEEINR